MNRTISICMACLFQFVLFAQTGTGTADYNPSNPPNPEAPAATYSLELLATPSQAGSFNTSTPAKYAAGTQVYLRAYNNSDYQFTCWTENGDTLSRTSSFYYNMPARHATLTAHYAYVPGSPANPEAPVLKSLMTLQTLPAEAGSFNWSSPAEVEVGESVSLYAYANTNYRFREWQQDGQTVSAESHYTFTMPKSGVQLVALYDYVPASPANPGKNYWNSATGEVIVDDFTPGSLTSAVSTLVGSNGRAVRSITVAGTATSNDWKVANSYSGCTLLDFSRTTGITTVPSQTFRNNSTLANIVLPATMESIERYAFQNSSALQTLTCHALTPPTVNSQAFSGVNEGLIVYVHAAVIGLYKEADGWKDFTVLPILGEVSALEVNLPEGTDPTTYKDMYIELINTKSGQKQRYVITNRTTYTFSSLIHNTQYNVYLRNQQGQVLGQISAVDIQDKDVSVTFASLLVPKTLTLQLLTPAGDDVAEQATITWTDGKNTYLGKGRELPNQIEGQRVRFSIALPQQLALEYVQPADSLYEVTQDSYVTCTLEAIPQRTITGLVSDIKTGTPLNGATVAVSQILNGIFSKTLTTKTDAQGRWTLSVYEAPIKISASMADYASKSVSMAELADEVPAIELKDLNGTDVTVELQYLLTNGETQDYYGDYQNIAYSIRNLTLDQDITDFNVQYPKIVLMEQYPTGTELLITATSKNQKFMPVQATAIIDELDRATVKFEIKQLGGIEASFDESDNASVTGILYNQDGRLVKSYGYEASALTISELQDGEYTLISMGSSQFFNSIGQLAQFGKSGLRENIDYVKSKVTVRSGEMKVVSIQTVPFLDETKLYYTGSNTSFTVNKTQITAGQYLTLTSHIDFKSAYSGSVGDVRLIIDLPENVSFVDNSVMIGSRLASYTYVDNEVVIPLDNYNERVRFCIIPTAGGVCEPAASVQFAFNGRSLTQPIGTATTTVEDLTISVPTTVPGASVAVSGIAVGRSTVEFFDNGTPVGQTTALANGTFATTINLVSPYNLSNHEIYAKVTTVEGLEMLTETKTLSVDRTNVEPKTVYMSFYNSWLRQNIEILFDLQNKTVNANSYMFYTATDFTFVADLTNNDPSIVHGVVIRVYTDRNTWRNLNATYNKEKDKWVAVDRFAWGELPVGIKVSTVASSEPEMDADEIADIMTVCAYKQEETEIYTAEVEKVSDDISAVRTAEERDEEAETELNGALAELIGIDVTNTDDVEVPASDEELTQLIDDTSELLDDDLTTIIDDLPDTDLSEASTYDEEIAYGTADGLQPETLEEDGYEAIKNTDGTLSYVKADETTYSFVDFSKNVHISVDATNDTSKPQIPASASLTDFSNLCCTAIVNQANSVKEHVDGFISSANETYGLLGQRIDLFSERWKQLNLVYVLKRNSSARFPTVNFVTINGTMARIEKSIAKLRKAREYYATFKNGRTFGYGGSLFSLYDSYQKDISTIKNMVGSYNAIAEAGIILTDEEKQILENEIRKSATFKLSKALTDKIAIRVAANGISLIKPTRGKALSAVFAGLFKKDVNDVSDRPLARVDNKIIYVNKVIRSSGSGGTATIVFKSNGGSSGGPYPGSGSGSGSGSGGPYPGSGSGGGTGSGGGWVIDHYDDDPPYPRIPPIHDPSGYVYEGVASNRLQGVTATAYYKETVEDMYGDLKENVVLWNAEEYAQQNPLFTDENGMYRWDVPQGLWQVMFEKDGYQTTYSEWLPVPPPQLEVNIAMTQLLQPSVKKAQAFDEGIEVEFDKYMDPATLTTDNIRLSRNGELVEGTIVLLNEEKVYEGQEQTYASKVRFAMPEGSELLYTDEVQLTVSRQVKSYAGMAMEQDYIQEFEVEPKVKTIVADELVNIAYGGERTLTVAALPAEASRGKKMLVRSLSTMIADTDLQELTLDENGQAELKVTGELPGQTVLAFEVESTDVEAMTTVKVKEAEKLVTVAPRASRISGTQLYRGTEIRLTSETDDATIYYTLDGSCPCNTETALLYNPDEPIVIASDNVTIKAMAQGKDLAESDVAEFNYTLKKTTVGYQLPEGWTWLSHNVEQPVAVTELEGKADRIVSQTQEAISDPVAGLVGNLEELLPTETYKVKAATPANLTLQGFEFNARDNSVAVEPGWNWIGYPVSQTMTVEEALAFWTPAEGDCLVGQDGFAEYADGQWQGTLEGMAIGKGYLYKSAVAGEIPFNTAIVSTAASRIGKRNLLLGSPWAADKHAYRDVMPLTARLVENGTATTGYTVAAFEGTECRGVGLWKEGRLLMSVYGQPGDDIRFVAASEDGERFYDLREQLTFVADTKGTWHAPMTLTLGSETTGLKQLYSELSVTPAVAYDHLSVSAGGSEISRLTLTNMGGQIVMSLDNLGKGATLAIGQLKAGMYIVTVKAGGQSYYKKIMKANK